MTDTATQTTTTTSAPPPAFDAGGDSLSPAELAYFESGGEKTEGLSEPAAPATDAQQTTSAPVEPEAQRPDDAVDGEITINADGKPINNKTGRFVPHQALHAEREKRKTVETELAQTRERFTRADERLAVLNEALKGNAPAAAQQPAKVAPKPEEDIIGYIKHQQEEIAALKAQLNKSSGETQVHLARTALRQHYDADVTNFSKVQPQFEAAKSYLVEGRHKELEAIGVSDKAERQRMIDQQEAQLALEAYRGKRSAPEMLYNLAVARGYQPPAATNGAANGKSAGEQRIEAIEKGQRAAASLTSAPGGAAGELTLQALADMPQGEFDKAVEKLGGVAALRRMMGG